jgi:hypothetical protein
MSPDRNPNPATSRKPRPRKPAPRKNTKVTGERSEAAFLYRASNPTFNFGIAKPWGDSRRYDFIVDNGHVLHRIQIKCTECIRAQAYETRATYSVGKGRAVYTKADIDFIAAHVVPLDIWYIIPVEICTPQPMLRFYPHRQAKKMRLEKYREAWHLLQSQETNEEETEESRESAKIEIQARADETIYRDHDSQSTSITIVIPSEGADPRSGSAPQSRDLGFAVSATKSAAPWPLPPLTILATRKGKQTLPTPRA